jgi:hypothetical protein
MTDKAELEALAVRLSEAAALPNGLYAEASTAIRALLAENERLAAGYNEDHLLKVLKAEWEAFRQEQQLGGMNADQFAHYALQAMCNPILRQALQETDNAG